MARTGERHVGRDAELRLVDELVAGTRAGHANLLFVSGEPGIGKTHLLSELVRRGEAQGCLVLEGSAAEFEHELPFGPVIDALDAYVQSLGPRIAERLATDGLRDLAEVFPSLRSLRSGPEPPPTTTERFRSYHAVRELLERLGAQQPLVLVLDDLHWADGSSLELLEHLLRRPPEGPVMMAASFRSGQLDPVLLAAIESAAYAGTAHRVELGPLTPDQADVLVAGVDATTRERLYHQSGGNPFYLLQIARSGAGATGSARVAGTAVPPVAAAAIARELAALSPAAHVLAEAAAVVGDPFELDLALATADQTEPVGLAAVDELIARDLVRPAAVPRRFRFRHPLVRSAIYEAASTGTRLATHARCAAALADQGAPATTRAFHVEQSARPGDRVAVDLLVEAGQATARRQPSTSARWFEAALRLLPGSAPATERIALLRAGASALAAAGRLEEARSVLVEAIALVAAEDGQERVRLTSSCAGVELRLGRHGDAHGRLVAALDDITDRASEEGVELMVALSADAWYRLEYPSMREWATAAVAGAAALDQPLLRAAADAVLALACAFNGAVEEATACCRAAAEVVDALSDDVLAERIDAIAHLAGAEVYLDRYADAAAHSRRGIAVARASGQDDVFPMLYPCIGIATWVTGRLSESAAVLDTAIEAARLSGNRQSVAWSLLNRSIPALLAGDLDLSRRTAEESVEVGSELGDSFIAQLADLMLGWALCEDGEAARGAELLMAAGGGPELPRIAGGWRTTYLWVLVRALLAVGDVERARTAADAAVAVAAQTGLPRTAAMAHRATAEVALHEGRSATAIEEAARSVAAADASSAHLDAAISRVVLGRAHGQAGDAAAAVAHFERAATDLDAFGARRSRDEAERELRRLGHGTHRRSRPGSAQTGSVESLSGRELEIARLVVDRRTNGEIAADLFLSLKTVESHMRNIFRKLDVSSHVEVARVVERAS